MDKTTGTDPLFLGLTRPALVWGVPQPIFVINGMIAMIAFLVSNSFLPLLIGAPLVHALAYGICIKEVRMFELWMAKARFLRGMNRRYWKASSYDPFL